MSTSTSNGQNTPDRHKRGFLSRLRDDGRGAAANSREPQNVEGRWPLPGLAPMTRVETSFGKVHAVALRRGDAVKTRDGKFREIVWLNRVLLDQSLLLEKPDANPVRIRAGAMGPAVPTNDIMVSPRQKICPGPKTALENKTEAANLEGKSGISRQPESGLSYTMFHLGEAAEVECDGVFMYFEPPRAQAHD